MKETGKVFGVLQRVGRAFMLPIAVLPVAGLLLGIGRSLTNETMLRAYHLMKIMGPGTILYGVIKVGSDCGSIIFDNLPLIFAMGVSIGMAKAEKAVAALSGALSFFVMHEAISSMLSLYGDTYTMHAGATDQILGITSLQLGVFGGILVGLGVGYLHNRFYKIKLPEVLSFFGGTRAVPVICTIVYVGVGILMFFIWPPIQNLMYSIGGIVRASGYLGTFIYGVMERALIPFGLHHVFYLPFWQTSLGGTMEVAGKMIDGAQNIFFAQLADPATTHFNVEATRFMAGKFPFMIFGLPAAAFAMYKTARPEKKKVVGSLLLSAALTSMITGITEPLEFTFLFVAPLMYAVHCVLAGLSYMLMHILNVGVGMTFSGGLIDMTLFGILQGNAKTHWIWIVVVGLIYAVVYYFVFYFMITKMNLKTPGREPDDVEPKLYRRSDVNEAKAAKVKSTDKRASDVVSAMILKGLGGKDNLSDVDCCATRLRVTVNDASKVMDDMLKASGASGVIHKGNGVQVIYGPKVSVIKSDLEDFIDSPYSDDPDSIIGTEEASDKTEEKPQTEGAENTETQGKTITLYSHMNGTAVKLEDVEDEVFSQKILGEGAAVEPSEGKLYAPCDGKIDSVFDTKHAVNMVSDDGVEILLHIGIDTVKLGGQYFEAHVSDGQEVKKGDLLISFDMDKIKAAGYKVTTPIIIGNTDDYASVEPAAENSISAGDIILKIK